jgi:hypothetical protein
VGLSIGIWDLGFGIGRIGGIGFVYENDFVLCRVVLVVLVGVVVSFGWGSIG